MRITVGRLRRLIAESALLEVVCAGCKDENTYAEPNQPDGSFICRTCRDRGVTAKAAPTAKAVTHAPAPTGSLKVYPLKSEDDARKYCQGTKWPLGKYFNAYTKNGYRFIFVVKGSNTHGPAERFMCAIDSHGKEQWFDVSDKQVDPEKALGQSYFDYQWGAIH